MSTKIDVIIWVAHTMAQTMAQGINPIYLDNHIQGIYKFMLRQDYTQAVDRVVSMFLELSHDDTYLHTRRSLACIYQHIIAGRVHQAHDSLRELHYHIIRPFLFGDISSPLDFDSSDSS